MKNLLLSTIVCLLTFTGTSFLLKKYAQKEPLKTESATELNKNSEISDENNEKDLEESKNISKAVYTVNIDPLAIEKEYSLWSDYNTKNIELSYEFTPIDNENVIIPKEDFLNKLKTGLYIPLKVDSDEVSYKLHKISESADEKIKKSIKFTALVAYNYFKKEGEPLPEFNFVGLNGNEYSTSSTQGKIKIIKCWFINCVVCVQEFPELNELYDRYESNENVVFLSLAFDKTEKLKNFLIKKEFRYPVIAEQKKYMTKKLNIKQYPTHLIVNEDGNIVKMVSNVKALISFIDQMVGNENYNPDEEDIDENEDYNTDDNEISNF